VICLLPNCCFLSETSRMLEIRRALLERGADVRVATHGGTYEWILREAGVAYDRLGSGLSAERCARFVRTVPGTVPPDHDQWSDEELRTFAAAEAEYFGRHGVCAAVTGWTLSALLSTRVAGIPLVTEHAGSWVPPMSERGLLPLPFTPVGIPFERRLPGALKRHLYNGRIHTFTGYTGAFNRVAAELGVVPVPSFAALLLGDLALVTDVPEVLGIPASAIDGWTPRHPASYRAGTRLRLTGPIFARLDLPVPDRVERFLQAPGPKVYVAITSSTPDLIRTAVAGLRALDAHILVAGTVHDLGDLAGERVVVEAVLPSHLIMPRVDLAVTAGGQGSVQTALTAGTPLLGVPLQPEQHLNLHLARRAGVADLVAPAHASAREIESRARAILADPRYRRRAARLRHTFGRVDGPGNAADAILELTAAGRPLAAGAAR
jgi:UDP:flavonoid glycosyltransferase YjiC (YdhE family)